LNQKRIALSWISSLTSLSSQFRSGWPLAKRCR
jgi:hypothetical protein